MGQDSGGSSYTNQTTRPDPEAQAMNALRYGNTLNYFTVNGPDFPGFGQPSPYATPTAAEQAQLNAIAQYGQQLGPSPMQQTSIDWLQSAGPNYLNQVNQTGQQAYDNLRSVGNLLQQEYGTARTELGNLGVQMQGLYNGMGGNVENLINSGQGIIGGYAGNAASIGAQGQGAIAGYGGTNAGILSNALGQVNQYGQKADMISAPAQGQIDASRGVIGDINSFLQSNMGENRFEPVAAGYWRQATDPTAQLAAGQNYLETIAADELANRLQQGGFGGVRGGAYQEALTRAGAEMALPILSQVMTNQAAAGDAYLDANTALRHAGVLTGGVMTQGQADLMDAANALAAARLASNTGLANVMGNVSSSGMTSNASLANAAASLAGSQLSANTGLANAAANVFGTQVGGYNDLLRTGMTSALGYGQLANDIYQTGSQTGLGYLNQGNQLMNNYLGGLQGAYGAGNAGMGTTLQYGLDQGTQDMQRQLMALQALGAPRQLSQDDYLRRQDLTTSMLLGMPYASGLQGHSRTSNAMGVSDYTKLVGGLIGSVAGGVMT